MMMIGDEICFEHLHLDSGAPTTAPHDDIWLGDGSW
jgi:hypothetical protein